MSEIRLTLPLGVSEESCGFIIRDAENKWVAGYGRKDHAERIVRAVNSHEALVEALEALRSVLKDEASVKVTADFAGQMMFGRAVVLADAALALAKNGREG